MAYGVWDQVSDYDYVYFSIITDSEDQDHDFINDALELHRSRGMQSTSKDTDNDGIKTVLRTPTGMA